MVEKPDIPDIRDIAIRDTADGVMLDFRLDEGLEDTDTSILWVRAKVPGYEFYQPVSGLEVLPGGRTATAVIPNRCITRAGTNPDLLRLTVEWYRENYPEDYNEETFGERRKGEPFIWTGDFAPDWYGMSKWDHDTRVEFETRGKDHQISEARLWKRFSQEEDIAYAERGLSLETGLWMTHDGPNGEDIAISYEQPDMGQKWLRAWMDDILAALEAPE